MQIKDKGIYLEDGRLVVKFDDFGHGLRAYCCGSIPTGWPIGFYKQYAQELLEACEQLESMINE